MEKHCATKLQILPLDRGCVGLFQVIQIVIFKGGEWKFGNGSYGTDWSPKSSAEPLLGTSS